jgi:hypothetical protein
LLFFFFAKFSKLELFNLIQFFKNWIIMVSWPRSMVISVTSSLFFFFQFHPLILGWLRIRLHNFFRFAFYEVTPASWLGSRVWSINLSWLMWFFHVIFTCFFFFCNFILQHWVDWELRFIIYFNFFSILLSWSHDEG